MKNISLLFLCLIMLFSFNCKRSSTEKDNWEIELPATKTPSDLNQWAVNKFSLTRLREEPITKTKIVNYIKYAAILKILKKEKELKSFDNEVDYWYYVDYNGEKGWIFGTFLDVFNTYEESKKRSEKMIFDKK